MNELIDKFNAVPSPQKIAGLILLMGLIGAGFYFLLLSPTWDDTTKAQNQVAALQREKESLEQLKRNRAQVLAQLEKLQSQLLVTQEKLPQDAEIPSLLQRVHNQAKTAGLDINRFERVPDVSKDFYVEIPVKMELAGTYDELANFLFYIGRMTRIVNVRNLALRRESKDFNSAGELMVTASATTFRYKSNSEMKPKSAPKRKRPKKKAKKK